jgi:hypothetical protein
LAGIWDDFVMQGFERMDGELLDAAVGHLVPAGSMFAFLAAHQAEMFPDADYADLFAPPGVGRPSLPATRMAAVLTLQVLHDYRTGRRLRRPGSTCGGRRRPACRWMIRDSTSQDL